MQEAPWKRRVSVLGSTGSVGTQALDVIDRLSLPVAALAALRSVAQLEAQARRFRPALAVLFDEAAARDLKIRLADTDIRVSGGEAGLLEAAAEGDTVLTALTGIAGLAPTLAAIDAGRDIALANKETLVCAGELVMARARAKGVGILPVDSEHSAVFQCLQGQVKAPRRILLTASGGPFYGKTRAETDNFGPAEALSHPTWRMGPKITVDCATLMNKGLEYIEAMRLYGVSPGQIEVLIHRESVVHSLVGLDDRSVLAQLGVPDMRLPIQYALTYPARLDCPVEPLDLCKIGCLRFAPPDYVNFPCLALAMEAARTGGGACAVLNGANEAAVELFLQGRIRFGHIAPAVEDALSRLGNPDTDDLAAIYAADTAARAAVARFAANLQQRM